jgi:hypothetical protein
VRLYTRVTETPIKKESRLCEEHVRIERQPMDCPAAKADLATITEGMIEVTPTTEEPVVSRPARVVEEVVVSTDVEERRRPCGTRCAARSRLSASADRHAMGWPNGEPRA